jgi:DDE family transposase
VRLQLHALAYNLGNFLRTLALPDEVKHWSLATLRDRLVKIGAKTARRGRSITFQMAEVMLPRGPFQEILAAIAALRPAPPARCRDRRCGRPPRLPAGEVGLRAGLWRRSGVVPAIFAPHRCRCEPATGNSVATRTKRRLPYSTTDETEAHLGDVGQGGRIAQCTYV